MNIKQKIIGCLAIASCCNLGWAYTLYDSGSLMITCDSMVSSDGEQMKNISGDTGLGFYLVTANSSEYKPLDFDCRVARGLNPPPVISINLYGESSLKRAGYQNIVTHLWTNLDSRGWIDHQFNDDHGQISLEPMKVGEYLSTDVQFKYQYCSWDCDYWNDQFYIGVMVCNDNPVPCRYNPKKLSSK